MCYGYFESNNDKKKNMTDNSVKYTHVAGCKYFSETHRGSQKYSSKKQQFLKKKLLLKSFSWLIEFEWARWIITLETKGNWQIQWTDNKKTSRKFWIFMTYIQWVFYFKTPLQLEEEKWMLWRTNPHVIFIRSSKIDKSNKLVVSFLDDGYDFNTNM